MNHKKKDANMLQPQAAEEGKAKLTSRISSFFSKKKETQAILKEDGPASKQNERGTSGLPHELAEKGKEILSELYDKLDLVSALKLSRQLERLALKIQQEKLGQNIENADFNKTRDWLETALYEFASSKEAASLGLTDAQFRKEFLENIPALRDSAHEEAIKKIHHEYEANYRNPDISVPKLSEAIMLAKEKNKLALVHELENELLYRDINHALFKGNLMDAIDLAIGALEIGGKNGNGAGLKKLLRDEFFSFAYSQTAQNEGYYPDGVREALKEFVPSLWQSGQENSDKDHCKILKDHLFGSDYHGPIYPHMRKKNTLSTAQEIAVNALGSTFFSSDYAHSVTVARVSNILFDYAETRQEKKDPDGQEVVGLMKRLGLIENGERA